MLAIERATIPKSQKLTARSMPPDQYFFKGSIDEVCFLFLDIVFRGKHFVSKMRKKRKNFENTQMI